MAEIPEFVRLWIERIITSFGYPCIALLMFVEAIIPLIPSGLVMPFAGFMAARGRLDLAGVVLVATSGAVLGALALYGVGAWVDESLLRKFLRRYGRFVLLVEDDLERSRRFFDRYGEAAVFFGRLTALSLISLPAGMFRMPLGKFLLFTALGTALGNVALGTAGYVLAENWDSVLAFVNQWKTVVLLAIAVGVVGFLIVRRLLHSRRVPTQGTDDG